MNKADSYYKENLRKIMEEGSWDKNPRPKYSDGVNAYTKFISGVFEEYDISKGEFPIPTLRNTAIKTGIKEIMWIYQKQTSSLSRAREMGINWWEEWNIGNNTIGQRYGATIDRYDLMNNLLDGLVNDPFGRRHIINLYQYSDLNETKGLYPCAYETLWSVRDVNGDLYLDMTLIQRSSDYLMANFINKTQYLALQMMVAGHCGYKVGKLIHFVQNLHIYDRHFDAANELIEKEPFESDYPYMELVGNKDFYEYTIDDFKIYNVDKIEKLSKPLEIAI
jgi:thymidylate synthase